MRKGCAWKGWLAVGCGFGVQVVGGTGAGERCRLAGSRLRESGCLWPMERLRRRPPVGRFRERNCLQARFGRAHKAHSGECAFLFFGPCHPPVGIANSRRRNRRLSSGPAGALLEWSHDTSSSTCPQRPLRAKRRRSFPQFLQSSRCRIERSLIHGRIEAFCTGSFDSWTRCCRRVFRARSPVPWVGAIPLQGPSAGARPAIRRAGGRGGGDCGAFHRRGLVLGWRGGRWLQRAVRKRCPLLRVSHGRAVGQQRRCRAAGDLRKPLRLGWPRGRKRPLGLLREW